MVKKRIKKTPKKKADKVVSQVPQEKDKKLDSVLIENFVSLQRVLTNLAVNVDNLSNRIAKLLELFEISAKALAEKDFEFQEDTAQLVEKLDSLIDQNKVLARGMALMHERMPREQFPPPAPSLPPISSPPPFPTQAMIPMQGPNTSYTKEIPEPAQTPQKPRLFSNFESPIE